MEEIKTDYYKEVLSKMDDMPIGHRIVPDNHTIIIRVQTGWVWQTEEGCCFVPFSL